ncbi:PhoX family phosphatase [Blastococcus sp. TBT05-19]|nr:PhoX family phosphatase [Blastococcus sp. TBT05-19]
MAVAAGFLTTSLVDPSPAAAAPGSGGGGRGAKGGPLLGFTAVPPSTADDVTVAPGYRTTPLIPWGTAILGSFPAFAPGTPGEQRPDGSVVTTGNTAAQQAEQVGMNHDGITYFPLADGRRGNEHGLLVLNHEYTEEGYLHTGGFIKDHKPATAEAVRKSQNAHGVSVVEIRKGGDGQWAPVRSGRNRRITANTPMALSGPAAGHPLLRTQADPSGRASKGTINNCGNGETLWGTYLTCEENFNQYFRVEGTHTKENADLQKRYGVGGDSFGWAAHDPRFVVTPQDPNEPNRFGWIVEIDPFDPRSTPVKRTALGRLKHEDASMVISRGGRVVVYMGDDQVFEHAYKFVSADNWKSMRARGRSPLDEGTLFVAKFDDDGTGRWIALAHGQNGLTAANGFPDQATVLINARQAATFVGATPMDRPEWTAVDERTGTVYLTLTNNSGRKLVDDPTTPYDDRPNAANPRVNNRNGQVIRWDERGGDHTATAFDWDLFVLAGSGTGADGSTVDPANAFGSPDGLWVDPDGRAWIQTDGSQPIACNNQMLAADTATGGDRPEIRRFLVGVKECEVTGVATTPDRRTMFINLQHPGENGGSTWPRLDGLTVPRSATVVVTKDDGGVIGS